MEVVATAMSYTLLIRRAISVSVFIQLINWSLSYFLTLDNFTGFMNFNTLFIASVFYTNSTDNICFKQLLITSFGVLWNLRLTHYLIIRIFRRGGEDTRMNRMRKNPINLAKFWVIHASWCIIVSLPVTLINTINITFKNTNNYTNADMIGSSFSLTEIIGIFIYLYGLIIESLADYSKLDHWERMQALKSGKDKNKKNKNKGDNDDITPWCELSVWKYSRNPNFGGEIILWTGMAILSSNMIFETFRNAQLKGNLDVSVYTQYLVGYSPYLAPIFTAIVLLFLSGVNLHEWKDQKVHGNNERFKEYRRKTSPVWPCPQSIYDNVIPGFIKSTIMCEFGYYVRRDSKKKSGKHV